MTKPKCCQMKSELKCSSPGISQPNLFTALWRCLKPMRERKLAQIMSSESVMHLATVCQTGKEVSSHLVGIAALVRLIVSIWIPFNLMSLQEMTMCRCSVEQDPAMHPLQMRRCTHYFWILQLPRTGLHQINPGIQGEVSVQL